jgi:hypothetical protein
MEERAAERGSEGVRCERRESQSQGITAPLTRTLGLGCASILFRLEVYCVFFLVH